MTSSYLPSTEANALLWMQSFANGIAANSATYGVSATESQAISDAVQAFADALGVANENATRTPVSVNQKDVARNNAEALCRQFVSLIKYNAGISDAAKIAIGVRPVNPNRDPINAPDTSPLLSIIGATPGAQTVRYSDTNTPDSAAKPFGATALQLFVAIGDMPTTDEDSAEFLGLYTKNPIGVAFTEQDDGKVATYFARWTSRRGDVGPWSLPVAMRIAA